MTTSTTRAPRRTALWAVALTLASFAATVVGAPAHAHAVAAQAQPPTPGHPSAPVAAGTSAPLRDAPPARATKGTPHLVPLRPMPMVMDGQSSGGSSASSPAAPTSPNAPTSAPVATSFAGLDNTANSFALMPPDTNGDVGPNDYVQWVNLAVQVYDKTSGQPRFATPKQGNWVWQSLGATNLCASQNQGDPIALYDPFADRWVLSQFAFTTDSSGNPTGPYHQCMAVSTTSDPTGSYYAFDYLISNTNLNDYPKLGVWSDGYYLTVNEFSGNSFAGVGVFVLPRDRMIAGDLTAPIVAAPLITNGYSSLLPADVTGYTAPPAGAAEYLVSMPRYTSGSYLAYWKATTNWTTGTLSLTGPTTIAINAIGTSMSGIPQPDSTAAKLDPLDDRAMYRLNYRNMSNYGDLVVSRTVNVGARKSPHAAVGWWELRDTNGTVALNQQGAYAPDAAHRWMSSIAMDHSGDIGLGYSVSSSTVNPSVRFTGRVPTDAAGTMGTEGTIVDGGASQYNGSFSGSTGRWGDYSSMSVDPVDDCTFWYTQEYVKTKLTTRPNWATYIGHFKFPGCQAPIASVAPSSIDFGNVAVGSSSTQNVTISNASTTAPMQVTGISFGGTNASDFSTSFVAPVTILAGDTTTVPVTFTPGASGPRTATLTVTSDARLAPFAIALDGDTSCPSGQWLASYFNNMSLSGAPSGVRCESAINYDWGAGGPTGVGVGTDNFSVRWTQTMNVATAAPYTFTATADDGVRLLVDGTPIIDQWQDEPATTYSATANLSAGSHTVTVEYYENAGNAVIHASFAAS